MGKKYDYQYVVIGSGPAGSTVAMELAKRKKQVCLIEKRFFGGSNLNTRDLPYATALDFSHTYRKFSTYPEVSGHKIPFNFSVIATRQLKVIVEAGANKKRPFEECGINCVKGTASFVDKHTVAVGNRRITASRFILATGATLNISGVVGVDAVDFLTPEAAIRQRKLPQVVAVVGAGPSGCEIAEYYAELGAKVLLFETNERILPREDPEVAAALSDYFIKNLKMNIFTKARVTAIESDDASKRVVFESDGAEHLVRVESIVLATGSQPVLDYGLEKAGVKFTPEGIKTDRFFQTAAKNIYAIGDCLGLDSSTERARLEGLTLANNLVNRTKNAVNYQGLIRVVDTFPQVATIGLNEQDLIRRNQKYKKSFIDFNSLPISHIENFHHGFIKLLADHNNTHLLGATIVSPQAGILTTELAIVLRHGIGIVELASTPHIVNSYSYALQVAAKSLITNQTKVKPKSAGAKVKTKTKTKTKAKAKALSRVKAVARTKARSK